MQALLQLEWRALGRLLVEQRHVSNDSIGIVDEELLAACVSLARGQELNVLRAEYVGSVQHKRRVGRGRVLHVEVARNSRAQLADGSVGLALGVLAGVQRRLICLVVDDRARAIRLEASPAASRRP